MTRAPKALKAIFNWQRRSWIVNKPENTRRVLGKGLGSLLPSRSPQAATPEVPAIPETAGTIAIDLIDPNPLQPRRVFQQEKLAELAQSIRANGIVQPLV